MTSGHHQGERYPGVDPESAEAREPQETAAPGPDETVDGAAGSIVGDESPEMTDELAKAQQALGELTGDLQRLQAEYVNYKRRVDRDRQLVKENATFSVLSSLLPVLDDLDRAREHGELEGGFKVVADSLERIVAGLGLIKFGAPGDEFDPNLHDALMHSHSPDVTTTTCQNIVQAGYRIGDRVVRAARVTVVDPEPATQQDSSAQPDGAAQKDSADQPDSADQQDSTTQRDAGPHDADGSQ